jgi:LacI family transcriptional regulator
MPKDPTRKKVTISDVAREAGVAQMTVSRVVNGGNYVSASVQKRVREAIEKLGYQPNEAARILKGQKARIIGLIVPTLADTFFSTCANAVQEVATRYGYMTLIQTSSSRTEVETTEIDMMVSRNVAGLILIPMEQKASGRLAEVQASGVPIVTLDRVVKGLNANEVLVENALGAEEAVRHLIWHGHKQIACLGYDTELLSIHERIQGYTNAMREAGLQPQIWKVDSSKSIPAILQRKLEGAQGPTALFTLNNVTTIQTLHALQTMGIKLPKDLALAGFDDLELASLLTVPITVVRQSAHELGRTGAKLLFDMIRSGVSPKEMPKTRLILPTELVIRNSCGCKGTVEDPLAKSH